MVSYMSRLICATCFKAFVLLSCKSIMITKRTCLCCEVTLIYKVCLYKILYVHKILEGSFIMFVGY